MNSPPLKQKTLHETVSRRFNRTRNGSIFSKDIKDVFATLLLCLDLKEDAKLKTTLLGFQVQKSYPYSFTMERAVSQMEDLSVGSQLHDTNTTISYKIKAGLAKSLLELFMDAKLLHCPTDRTRHKPKAGCLLQPTPKGVYILHSFCKIIGIKGNRMPSILKSNFNSMILINFDRDPRTDTIIYSNYLLRLIFLKITEAEPNVWKPTNWPDPIPPISDLNDEDCFEFSSFSSHFDFSSGISASPLKESTTFPSPEQVKSVTPMVSPFAHKFFTNPGSSAQIQYYVSNKGVRVFKDKSFDCGEVDYCFTGKALIQWFMDCTDTMYPREAVGLAELLQKDQLIEPIVSPPSVNKKDHFLATADAYYTIGPMGREITYWPIKRFERFSSPSRTGNGPSKPEPPSLEASEGSSSDSRSIPNISLLRVLRDPGLRYLFEAHLKEDFCSENLKVYTEIKNLERKMNALRKLLMIKQQEKTVPHRGERTPPAAATDMQNRTINAAISKLTSECLSKAYNIYSSYLTVGAPYEVNIDHDLRFKITNTLMHPQSPLAESFFPVNDEELSPNSTSADESLCENQKGWDKFESPNSPLDGATSSSLYILRKVELIFSEIKREMYFLLENDSLPKFFSSEVYKDASATVVPHV
ncbi:unnamed protein product [Kuraishia capsulata CBS 1993]|uniref:RGS domain-containing protein n=1 Tax=Kuraishia capsulata CBS 1993 TaxID=1382522 RepID=W6MXV2_9ASCO|nr:uncharacterized protein KUCA_T00005522001 [Kuraishia capsulata CBS 1993]CDK29530.1 unnamed protein product [Kuraishia capsulata CBS 1993]